MKVFLAASSSDLDSMGGIYQTIINTLQSKGHEVLDSWVVRQLNTQEGLNISAEDLLIEQHKLIGLCDVVIAEVTTRSIGVGYLIGRALAERKHVLALYPENSNTDDLSALVKGSTSSLFKLMLYNEDDLEGIIREYIEQLEPDSLQKFNFLASQEVLDYIEKGAKRENKSKSEFLRGKILHKLVNGDR